MCRGPTVPSKAFHSNYSPSSSSSSSSRSCISSSAHTYYTKLIPQSIWPLPLWFVLACLPLLPSYCFLNRGYTQWFHWLALVHLLTQNAVLCQFIAVQSLLINVGWYATLLTDFHVSGNVGHILFRNMPELLSDHILLLPQVDERHMSNVSGQDVVLQRTVLSFICQGIAFGLDILLHPVLCYYFWNQCRNVGRRSVTQVCTLPILVSCLVLSRTWSILHCWYHYHELQFFYYGPHVYKVPMDHHHLWTAAYVGEAVTATYLLGRLVLEKYQNYDKRQQHVSDETLNKRASQTQTFH